MSDPSTDIAKDAVVEVTRDFAAPFVDILRDAVGGAVGDQVKVWRQSRPAWQILNQQETLKAAKEDLKRRRLAGPSPGTRPEHLAEVLQAAAENSSPEIRELFARLLTAAMDAARQKFYRGEFAQIVRQLEPIDALVLRLCNDRTIWGNKWRNNIAPKIPGYTPDEIELAGRNLERLGLLTTGIDKFIQNEAHVSALARQLLRVLAV